MSCHTTLVWNDDMVARCDQGGYLMAPRKRMRWPAVTENNWFSYISSACFKDFELHTVEQGIKEFAHLADDPAAGRICRPDAGRKKRGSSD